MLPWPVLNWLLRVVKATQSIYHLLHSVVLRRASLYLSQRYRNFGCYHEHVPDSTGSLHSAFLIFSSQLPASARHSNGTASPSTASQATAALSNRGRMPSTMLEFQQDEDIELSPTDTILSSSGTPTTASASEYRNEERASTIQADLANNHVAPGPAPKQTDKRKCRSRSITPPRPSLSSHRSASRPRSVPATDREAESSEPRVIQYPLPTAQLKGRSCILPVLPKGRVLKEIWPTETARYSRKHRISLETKWYNIPPVTTTFPHKELNVLSSRPCQTVDEWVPLTHPEGALFFFHEQKRVYTEGYVFDEAVRKEIEQFMVYLDKYIRMGELDIPSEDCELVLDIEYHGDSGITSWGYYYIDHTTKLIFWLREIEAEDASREVYNLTSPAHLAHFVRAAYWTHWDLYAAAIRPMPTTALAELTGHLIFCTVDSLTSSTSTAPYSTEDLHSMLSVLRQGKHTDYPYATNLALLSAVRIENGEFHTDSAIARLLATFSHWKFVNHHGQRGARLERDQSIYWPPPWPVPGVLRIAAVKVASIFLFRTPWSYFKDLEKICVDDVISLPAWRNYVMKLQSEWQEFILNATVVLNANVAFLAIPNVIMFPNNDNQPGGGNNIQSFAHALRSPAAIASYISTMASLASILTGLILVKHNRTKNKDEMIVASAYMKCQQKVLGLEVMAILYALPWSLLIWSIVFFLIAVLIFTFKDTDSTTRGSVGTSAIIAIGLVVWCLLSEWRFKREFKRSSGKGGSGRRLHDLNDSASARHSAPQRNTSPV